MLDATKAFGIRRTTLYGLLATGQIKSVSLKRRGKLRGRRLISADSARMYLETLAQAQASKCDGISTPETIVMQAPMAVNEPEA